MFIRAIEECKNEKQGLFETSKRVKAIRNKQSSKTLKDSFTRLEYALLHKDIRLVIKILENELFFEKIASYKIYDNGAKKFELVFINELIKMMKTELNINILIERYIRFGEEGFFSCYGDLFKLGDDN